MTLWATTRQAPLSMGFSRQGVGSYALLQGIFLTQGLNPHLLCLLQRQAGSLPLAPPGKSRAKDVLSPTEVGTYGKTYGYIHNSHGVSLVAQMVKNLPAMQETWVWYLGWEYALEESIATHSRIPAWRIPMDGGTWRASVHGVAVGYDWATMHSTARTSQNNTKINSRIRT